MAVVEPGGAIRLTRIIPLDADRLELHGGRKRLVVAVYSEFFPVAYRAQRTQRMAGFDVDLIEAFCRSAGLEPPRYVRKKEFIDIWNTPGRWSDRVDVAIGGIGRANYRDSPTIEWTVPYFEVRRTVVYRLSDPIRRFPEDVTGKVAGTMGSTGMNDAADRLEAKFGRKAWDHLEPRWKSPDQKDLADLLEGRIQGLMRGSFVGKAIVAQHPKKLGMAEPWEASPRSLKPYGREVFAFPCRRGSGLAAMLSLFLVRASHNGDLAKLAAKHAMA